MLPVLLAFGGPSNDRTMKTINITADPTDFDIMVISNPGHGRFGSRKVD